MLSTLYQILHVPSMMERTKSLQSLQKLVDGHGRWSMVELSISLQWLEFKFGPEQAWPKGLPPGPAPGSSASDRAWQGLEKSSAVRSLGDCGEIPGSLSVPDPVTEHQVLPQDRFEFEHSNFACKL